MAGRSTRTLEGLGLISPPPRANCFDASALVKVYTDEAGSDIVRAYFDNHSPTKYTTPFCFYETLNVLKVKWLYRPNPITKDEYLRASLHLLAWFGSSSRNVRDLDLTDPQVFFQVRTIADRHEIDLSDAFQIISVKLGYFAPLANESRTVLVTADERLAEVAEAEDVRAWYCLGGPPP